MRKQGALTPATRMAMSVHAQPGVYAVLLGSGVSSAAGIPTGWGVISDLVAQVAAIEDPDHDPFTDDGAALWWEARSDEPLSYSGLLAELAPTQAARQGLLAGYFTPGDPADETSARQPTATHHAVASLVKQGYVRVVLTTNFDRLTEQALEAAGVQAQVVARPEAIAGMTPLAHAPATVIKLHGDYRDLDTRNTTDELDHYPDQLTDLLSRILSDYGLIIAGWSAAWDRALVRALEAAPRGDLSSNCALRLD